MSGHVRTYIWTYLEYTLTFYLAYILAFYLAFHLAVEVQRCSLSSGAPRLRSSRAALGPCRRTLPAEVQRCSLRSDPARSSTDPELAKRMGEKVGEEDWRGGEEGGGRVALIKSDKPSPGRWETQMIECARLLHTHPF